MNKDYPPIGYHDYLKIDKLLDCQDLRSEHFKQSAHDEMLFIIIHQVYELWFKQILFEVNSVLDIFTGSRVDERKMGLVNSRLRRVVEIQKVLLDQINILETMTPLDFLDFRNMLIPASGFQSLQFRVLETKLGLRESDRMTYNNGSYKQFLKPEQAQDMSSHEEVPSLFDCVEKWLERTPFLQLDGFDFWQDYQKAVQMMFQSDKKIISENQNLGPEEKQRNFKIIENSEANFKILFDETEYEKMRACGHWRLSFKAIHAALLIQLYRDQPVFQLPFHLITNLIDIDELFTTWRYRHALMVKRMLGTKIGTGGSSGFEYLREATEKHRVFTDFFQLTTFFIPRSSLPRLPEKIEKQLGFFYQA